MRPFQIFDLTIYACIFRHFVEFIYASLPSTNDCQKSVCHFTDAKIQYAFLHKMPFYTTAFLHYCLLTLLPIYTTASLHYCQNTGEPFFAPFLLHKNYTVWLKASDVTALALTIMMHMCFIT